MGNLPLPGGGRNGDERLAWERDWVKMSGFKFCDLEIHFPVIWTKNLDYFLQLWCNMQLWEKQSTKFLDRDKSLKGSKGIRKDVFLSLITNKDYDSTRYYFKLSFCWSWLGVEIFFEKKRGQLSKGVLILKCGIEGPVAEFHAELVCFFIVFFGGKKE